MQYALVGSHPEQVETQCLVIGVAKDSPAPGTAATVDSATDGLISGLIESGDLSSKPGRCVMLHNQPGLPAKRILAVGVGAIDKLDRHRFRQICVAAGKALKNSAVTEAVVTLTELPVSDTDEGWRIMSATAALDFASYRYTETKPVAKDEYPAVSSVTLAGNEDGALELARGLIKGIERARQLGNLPPNICNPAYLVSQAEEIAAGNDKVTLEVLDRDQMQEMGMGSLLGVAQGSANPPYLIELTYRGAGAGDAPVAFVGKGITFDTGGISLKPGPGMDEMKYDMCGAAAVLGAFEACAEMGLPVNLTTIVPAVENMPGSNAYRPGDILTSMSGKTIEVLNTDAEGRLILCDSLTHAARLKPHSIVDVATLTGACVIALGHHASGLMTKSDDLADALLEAGEQSCDRAWRLPIWDDYQKQLDSPFADMANVGGKAAGAITAGCFLARFAEGETWAHLDIAGSAWEGGSKDGATGRPVALLVQYLMNLS